MKDIKDIESLVGNHPYKDYEPIKRFSKKVDEIIHNGPSSEEDVIKSYKEMYHLCVAYLIGASVNNAPEHPAYEAHEMFCKISYDMWKTGETFGDILRKNDVAYYQYRNKTMFESAREIFPFIDKKLLKENIEYLFPKE